MKTLDELRTQEKLAAIKELEEINENLKTASTTETLYGTKASGINPSAARIYKEEKEKLERKLKDKEYLDDLIKNNALNYRQDPKQKEYFGIAENDNSFTYETIMDEITKQIEEERKKENNSGKTF